MARLLPSRAPNLPLAPNQYQLQYHEQVNNALRLYFSRKDSNESALFGTLGGQFINNPYISASDSTDQYADGNDTPTLVLWDAVEIRAGFTLNADGTATVPVSGTYKIDFSLQFANNDNEQHDAYVWLQVNDEDVDNSSSRFTVPVRKSATEFGHTVAYSSIVFGANGGDKFGLYWATEAAAVEGGIEGVYMEHFPAQTTPYTRPANPSAIGSIVFLSCPCDANTL